MLLLNAAKAQARDELVLTDRSQGCTDNKSAVTTFNKVGENYIEANKNGRGIVLSRKQLLDLVTAIEKARSQSTFNPESLGITAQSVNLHTMEMHKAACHQSNSDYSKALQKLKEAFQYPAVVEAARLKMRLRDCGTQQVQYKLVIRDPKYWQQDFWSDHQRWSYQVGFQLDHPAQSRRQLLSRCYRPD